MRLRFWFWCRWGARLFLGSAFGKLGGICQAMWERGFSVEVVWGWTIERSLLRVWRFGGGRSDGGWELEFVVIIVLAVKD